MRKWLPLLAVCLGTFMLLIDVTIVNVALPDMVGDLHASFGSLQWVVDAYALALAALVLGTGSIADLVGHRRAYVAGLAVFALSSFVCGVAPGPGALIAARAVQGAGAAAMFATTFALLNTSYSGRDRGRAYGLWGAVSGASSAVGPVVGGLLTEDVSWRWIFFVNLPVSVAAIALCRFVFADPPGSGRGGGVRGGVDVPGMATFTAAAGCATYALIRANEKDWSNPLTWWMLALAAVLLAAFVAAERRSRHAMLDLALLRDRSFVGVLLAGFLLTFAAFSAFTYTSIWLQTVLRRSPIQAGLVSLPMSVMAFAVSALLGSLLHRGRPGPVIGGGLLLVGAGDALVAALVHGRAGWAALLPGLTVIGVGVGIVMPILGSVSMSLVEPRRGGMAAGASNTLRQLGFAFGVAVLGSVFAARARAGLPGVPGVSGSASGAAVARAVAGGQAPSLLSSAPAGARQALDGAVHAAAVTGVRGTYAVAATVGLVAGVLATVLVRPGRPASRAADSTGGPARVGNAGTAEPRPARAR